MRVPDDSAIGQSIRTQTPADPGYESVWTLSEIVRNIQQLLWLDTDESGDYWNADKEWNVETIEHVAQVLIDEGLRPHLGDGGA